MSKNAKSKTELIAALRSSEQEVVDRLSQLAPETLEEGRYENGWNALQIVAHVASIEWTYPRLIEVARGADSPAESVSGGVETVRVYNRPVDRRVPWEPQTDD